MTDLRSEGSTAAKLDVVKSKSPTSHADSGVRIVATSEQMLVEELRNYSQAV